MFLTRERTLALVVLGFVMISPSLAAEPHSHSGTSTPVQLQLDHGKKWQTDHALRQGMSEIHTAMEQSLPTIHKKAFTPVQYEALAERIQRQIDYVVGNCKLPEEADQQLHLVLEWIIDGVAEMKANTGRERGAVKIVEALGKYREYFEPAGW
jgi:hypothetical protein